MQKRRKGGASRRARAPAGRSGVGGGDGRRGMCSVGGRLGQEARGNGDGSEKYALSDLRGNDDRGRQRLLCMACVHHV